MHIEHGFGELVLSVWLCYTPIFGFLSVKKAKIPLLTAIAWPFIA